MGHIGKANFRNALLAGRILMLAASAIATPAAAAAFDGAWNVQIASDRASCGGGSSVSIGISNGQVASTNAMVTASGRVAEAGIINVALRSGLKRAVGSGRLSGTSGSGTWHGDLCSGTWTAQRIWHLVARANVHRVGSVMRAAVIVTGQDWERGITQTFLAAPGLLRKSSQ